MLGRRRRNQRLPKTVAHAIASLALTGLLAACGGSKGGTTTPPIIKTTPTITWPTPSAITYGTALSGTQLNATASVAGSFSYNPASGTVPGAGTQTLSVSFTPNDTTDYNSAAASVQIVVNKAVETIAWSNPAAITYGQALGATQLNATPSVPSSCAYTPAAGTVLTAGTQTLGVACTPTDTTDYTGATASVSIVVNKATPTITWPTPASITNTTPLSGTQLNATANVTGSFSYNPATGTTLPVGTDTLSVTFTPTDTTDYTSATGSVQIVVTQAPPTITSVTVSATPSSITNVQTTQCSATVTGTGAFSTGVTWTATGGTITSSGVFTPSGVGTGSCTATSTQDTSKSGSANITVTLRSITINANVGNQWSASCFYLFNFPVTQTGIMSGDNFYLNPYTPSSFSSTPGSTFTVTMGLTNTGTTNPCSPGAYDMYVSGSDGAVSNHHYVPIVGRWNLWGGQNGTDEFVSDPASGSVYKYKLSDGSADGTISTERGFAIAVDGNYLVTSYLGNLYTSVYNASTGAYLTTAGNNGDNITDVGAKSGIACYSQSTQQMVSCFQEGLATPAATSFSFGSAPAAMSMTKGCPIGSITASSMVWDEQGTTLYHLDHTTNGSVVTTTNVGSVLLNGFSPASAVTNTLARFVVTWDTNCQAVVVAPVATGTNPDGSTAYSMELALVNATSGSMRQLGTYVSSTLIPASVIRVVADPAGNAVILAATNESAGTTNLVRVSWTLDGSGNPTFTTTALASAPAVGVYGVSLGVLPNGKISIGQRQTHSLLPNQ